MTSAKTIGRTFGVLLFLQAVIGSTVYFGLLGSAITGPPGFLINAAANSTRMGLAALVMAEVVWVVARSVGANSGSGALLRVVVSTLVGAATYVVVLLALGSPEVKEVRSHLWPPAQTATLAE